MTQPRADGEPLNPETLRAKFEGCSDVVLETHSIGGSEFLFVYCIGMTDLKQAHEDIIEQLNRSGGGRTSGSEVRENDFAGQPVSLPARLTMLTMRKVIAVPEAVRHVMKGELLIYPLQEDAAYSIDLARPPQRRSEETNAEVSIRGPRDGFTESLDMNTALIRKRLQTEALKCKYYVIGRRSRTRVSMLYMGDLVQAGLLQDVERRLSAIDVDVLLNSGQFEELLGKRVMALFPVVAYTGRPDFAADALARGRVVLLMDGSPIALMVPVTFWMLLKTAEDAEQLTMFGSLERVLRATGMFLAVILPGAFISLTNFHQDQIPFVLLSNIVQSRVGVPLPIAGEAIIMLLLFELLREAGARLPAAIGQTLTLVGGLIIGDAAIRAGITSPGMVVIIAVSAVASFTLVTQTLIGAVSIMRLVVLAVSSVLGLFGLLVSLFAILIVSCHIRSFGVPYMAPLEHFSLRNLVNILLKAPTKTMNERPSYLSPPDLDKQGDKP